MLPGTMQETIILAVLPAFLWTQNQQIRLQNSVGTDQYTLIEQSGDYTKLLQTASGYEV